MLGIIILIGIGSLFYNFAKNNGLNKIVWPIIGLGSYFMAQIFVGIIIGITDPNMLDDSSKLMIIGLIAGIVGTAIAAGVMKMIADKKSKRIKLIESELLDDDSSTFFTEDENKS